MTTLRCKILFVHDTHASRPSEARRRKRISTRVSIDLEGVKLGDIFDQFVLDMSDSLRQESIEFVPGPNGSVTENLVKVGQIIKWEPPTLIEIKWKTAATWDPDNASKVIITFEPLENEGTRITLENKGWGELVGDRGFKFSEWFVDEIVTNLFKVTSPIRFTNWLTDKRARRPSGAIARATYRDPLYHRPNFKAILHYLQLKKDDYLIEIGCGGGAFLSDALKSGCRAAAIDHSPDMVSVAKELNSDAIAQKRLEITLAEADTLPFPSGMFTCAVSTAVFGFFDNPVKVLTEIHRVLGKNGRLALFTDSKELKGTPAAPEPIASQNHFYEDQEIVELAKKAGFESARVERPDLGPYAREAGLPEDLIKLFSGPGEGQLLLANKR